MILSITFSVNGSEMKNIEVEPTLPLFIYFSNAPDELLLSLRDIVYRELVKRGETPQKIEIAHASII